MLGIVIMLGSLAWAGLAVSSWGDGLTMSSNMKSIVDSYTPPKG